MADYAVQQKLERHVTCAAEMLAIVQGWINKSGVDVLSQSEPRACDVVNVIRVVQMNDADESDRCDRDEANRTQAKFTQPRRAHRPFRHRPHLHHVNSIEIADAAPVPKR